MSDERIDTTSIESSHSNVIPLSTLRLPQDPKHIGSLQLDVLRSEVVSKTPIYDGLIAKAKELNRISKYRSEFDYKAYRDLEIRYADRKFRGGFVMKTGFRLVNSHSTCQQCLYSFEVDTYGRGCIHDCVYCYAKSELTVHGYWNNPIPAPIDINEIRKAFYIAFETDKPHKFKDLITRKIPLRIGSMSDSFMWTDKKYGVTQELLKILKFYRYPYIIFTRSDLVAEDSYLKLLDKKLCSVQFSMSSTNEKMTRAIEPGAPSPKRRLAALQKLAEADLWTTVRINPLFPIFPDGYFTNPNFKWDGVVPKFEFSSFEMIDELFEAKVPAVLAGFARLSSYAINNVEKVTGFNLRPFYDREKTSKSLRDFHYSDSEIQHYYLEIKKRCDQKKIQFTTCYIGNGESHFWNDQKLWSNKKDCCNARDRVEAFKSDCREIKFEDRLKFSTKKDAVSDSDRLHDPLGT